MTSVAEIKTPQEYADQHKRAFREGFNFLNAHFPPVFDSTWWEKCCQDVRDVMADGTLYTRFQYDVSSAAQRANAWGYGYEPNTYFKRDNNRHWYLPEPYQVRQLYNYLGHSPKALFRGGVSGFEAAFHIQATLVGIPYRWAVELVVLISAFKLLLAVLVPFCCRALLHTAHTRNLVLLLAVGIPRFIGALLEAVGHRHLALEVPVLVPLA